MSAQCTCGTKSAPAAPGANRRVCSVLLVSFCGMSHNFRGFKVRGEQQRLEISGGAITFIFPDGMAYKQAESRDGRRSAGASSEGLVLFMRSVAMTLK